MDLRARPVETKYVGGIRRLIPRFSFSSGLYGEFCRPVPRFGADFGSRTDAIFVRVAGQRFEPGRAQLRFRAASAFCVDWPLGQRGEEGKIPATL